MTSQFPGALDNFTNPTPGDNLNTPQVLHSTQHANENDAIEAIEAWVGISGTSEAASHEYRIKQLENTPPGAPIFGVVGQDEGIFVGTGTVLNVVGEDVVLSRSGTVLQLTHTNPAIVFPQEVIGIYGRDEGIGLGTGTVLDVVGDNISLSLSGNVLQLSHTNPTVVFPQSQIGVFAQDEGIPLGTGTTINFVGENVDASISGSVIRVFVTGTPSSPVVFPQELIGVMGWDEGQPLGTGTVLNVVGSGGALSLSGTVLNLNLSSQGGGGGGGFGFVGWNHGEFLGTGTVLDTDYNLYASISGSVIKVTDGQIPLDPIGNALRNSSLGYWKMDELSGIRKDSSHNGNDLYPDGFTGTYAVSSVGVVGNSVRFVDVNNKVTDLSNLTFFNSLFEDASFYMGVWVKNHILPVADEDFGWDIGKFEIGLSQLDFSISYYHNLLDVEYIALAYDNFNLTIFVPGVSLGTPLPQDTWHFVEVYRNATNDEFGIALNNGSFTTATYSTIANACNEFRVGNFSSAGVTGSYTDMDELIFMPRVPTQAERDYLWNNGNGRTLYDGKIDNLGVYALLNGVPLGTGTWLNIGNGLTASVSGTVLQINGTAPVFPQEVIGVYGKDEGQNVGTGTILNVVGDNVALSLSGTTLTLLHTNPTIVFPQEVIGVMGQDEGVPLGTGTSLNVVGNNIALSLSGTVLQLTHTDTPVVFPQEVIGVYGLNKGVPLGTGTILNVNGSRLVATISGTSIELSNSPDPVELIGLYGQDEGVNLGTGTVLNVVGDNVSLSLSGTVLNISHTNPAFPQEVIGVMGWDDGVPKGTGTVIDFGSSLTATLSGTVLRVDVGAIQGSVAIQSQGTLVANTSTIDVMGAVTVSGSVVNLRVPKTISLTPSAIAGGIVFTNLAAADTTYMGVVTDLTGYAQCRLGGVFGSASTANASGAIIHVMWATGSSYAALNELALNKDTEEGRLRWIASTQRATDWFPINQGAAYKEVGLHVKITGGNGVADPNLLGLFAEFR